MTAPAAPVLSGHSIGTNIALRWPDVATAATYKVYAGPATGPTTLLATVAVPYAYVRPLDYKSFVRVTAVNAGAEESAYSNELTFYDGGEGSSPVPTKQPRTRPLNSPFG